MVRVWCHAAGGRTGRWAAGEAGAGTGKLAVLTSHDPTSNYLCCISPKLDDQGQALGGGPGAQQRRLKLALVPAERAQRSWGHGRRVAAQQAEFCTAACQPRKHWHAWNPCHRCSLPGLPGRAPPATHSGWGARGSPSRQPPNLPTTPLPSFPSSPLTAAARSRPP